MKALEEALRSNSKLRQQVKVARAALEGIRDMDLYTQNAGFGGETADRFHAATARARAALKLMDHPDAG